MFWVFSTVTEYNTLDGWPDNLFKVVNSSGREFTRVARAGGRRVIPKLQTASGLKVVFRNAYIFMQFINILS